jgi:hypothetical protein
MKPDALILAICHPKKLSMLLSVIPSIDKSKDHFDKRILAVDEFGGMEFPNDLVPGIKSKGWDVLIDNHHSRIKSMLHGVESSESDWIFYSEDDILINLPDSFNFGFLQNIKDDEREMGMLSLTFGGTVHDLGGGNMGDMAFVDQNTIHEDDDAVCFIRIEDMKDSWFFEFPGLFVRKDILQQVLKTATEKWPTSQIEIALTNAWFDLGMEEKYYKASYLKKEFLEYKDSDPMKIISDGRFFEILDPTQGNSQYGGNHNAY